MMHLWAAQEATNCPAAVYASRKGMPFLVKDTAERRKLLNAAGLVFLCLPDAAAVEAVSLIENGQTRVIDCSTAHRTAEGWVYGFPGRSVYWAMAFFPAPV